MTDESNTLREVADLAIQRAKGKHQVAHRILLSSVMADARLLAELVGLTREQVSERVEQFLRDGASHANVGSQSVDDSASPSLSSDGGASQSSQARHLVRDRPAAPPSHPPAKTAAQRKAAIDAANSIYDERIHATTEIRWGDITRRDYWNLKIRNAFTSAIERELEPLIESAPDDDTPTRQYIDEPTLRRIRNAAVAERDKALANVKKLEAQ